MEEKKSHWSLGLVDALNDPKLQFIKSEIAVVIKDKYPKAKYHFLVLPLANIASIYHLRKEHLPILTELDLLAKNTIEVTGHPKDEFKVGYHLSPSMQRLHLHVISNDFDSPSLKSKTHWNSFTTEFFLSPKYVYDNVEQYGRLVPESKERAKELIKTELKCHKCLYKPKNMPDLKQHIKIHLKI